MAAQTISYARVSMAEARLKCCHPNFIFISRRGFVHKGGDLLGNLLPIIRVDEVKEGALVNKGYVARHS